MQYRTLGRTDIKVSQYCLGSMTWGTQNSEAEGHEQIDAALDAGINFIDTAEMYPTNPLSAETAGRTEEIIGTWFAKSGRRQDIVLASKIVGDGYANIRDGGPVNTASIRVAIEGSLRRLQTEVIDLYQIHWPNRGSYHFRKWHSFDPTTQDKAGAKDDILETLEAMQTLINEGKIRAVGLSNESTWGTAQFLDIAEKNDLPRVVSVQNEYSLLCRPFDLDFAELSHHEDVGLLAFSPLAAGILSGKYMDGTIPPGSRRSIVPDLGGRFSERLDAPVATYAQVAEKHGLSLVRMALAFCASRPHMTSVIFGATSMAQLSEVLAATEITLAQEVLDDIQTVYVQYPMPM